MLSGSHLLGPPMLAVSRSALLHHREALAVLGTSALFLVAALATAACLG